MQRRQLEMQADRIEAILASHRVQARVWGGTISPRHIRFDLNASPDTKVAKITGLAEEIALSLAVPAVRIYRQNAAIHVEVPRLEDFPLLSLDSLLAALPTTVPPCSAVLGVDEAGKSLLLRLSSPDVVHVLVSGMTGSGKTVLLRTALASLCRLNTPAALGVLLIDPKAGRGLDALAGFPHVHGARAVDSAAEGEQALRWAILEMERRDRERRTDPRLIVAVDELADLAMVSADALGLLTRLVQRGREAGIHVLAGTQRPTADVIGGQLRANFPCRIVGQVASAQDAAIAAGRPGTGAEKLAGRGDFILTAGGRVLRFQAAAWEGE